jgi:arginine decarboxylase
VLQQKDYLKFTRNFNAKFPGFATDVHGLVHELDEETGRGTYYVDCVKQ